jgi:hypothetical protein
MINDSALTKIKIPKMLVKVEKNIMLVKKDRFGAIIVHGTIKRKI